MGPSRAKKLLLQGVWVGELPQALNQGVEQVANGGVEAIEQLPPRFHVVDFCDVVVFDAMLLPVLLCLLLEFGEQSSGLVCAGGIQVVSADD